MDLTLGHLSTGSDPGAVVSDTGGLSTSHRAFFFFFFNLIPDTNMWWFLLICCFCL